MSLDSLFQQILLTEQQQIEQTQKFKEGKSVLNIGKATCATWAKLARALMLNSSQLNTF